MSKESEKKNKGSWRSKPGRERRRRLHLSRGSKMTVPSSSRSGERSKKLSTR